MNPWTDARLRALNPLAKLPTLVTDDGTVLHESTVILDYLESLAPGRTIPAEDPARWRALLLLGRADGAATTADLFYADEHRALGERSEAMMARFRAALDAALDQLEQEPLSAETPTMGDVAAAALLIYLDFRWPERDWRARRPSLAARLAAVAQRPSLVGTVYLLP